jgi:ribA/ribD-fused uncharacterized protein
MMSFSMFIENRAYFGGYPTQEFLEELELEHNVRYFIDLTCDNEKGIKPYTTKYNYIRYPILDNRIPDNIISFVLFIIKLKKIIDSLNNTTDKIYIHCRGGHGRSGIVVASLLCYIYKINSNTSVEMTTCYYHSRKNLPERRLSQTSPRTNYQKTFVHKLFSPIYFYKAYKTGNTIGFSNFSFHTVKTELGVFPTSEAAFQAYKDPTNLEYVKRQQNSKSPSYSKFMGKRCNIRKDWEYVKNDIMYNILKAKFEQNEDIRINLLNTYFRSIRENCPNKTNRLGIILEKVRDHFYDLETLKEE